MLVRLNQMAKEHSSDPLHGVTLKTVVTELVAQYGWQELGERIAIKCFTTDPSITSSLKFLRKTPWAREKVEKLFITTSRHPLNDGLDTWPYSKN